MRILRTLLGLTALTSLLLGSAAAANDFDVLVRADGTIEYRTGGPPFWALSSNRPDDAIAWNVTTPNDSATGVVEFQAYFNVTRPRQVVPRNDGLLLREITLDGFATDAGQDAAFNATGSGASTLFRVRVPEGVHNLSFAKDTKPPSYEFLPVRNVTFQSFLVVTRTSERTMATLYLRPVAGGDTVLYPTAEPALEQRFPIVALKGATTYEYWITFRDYSENAATTETQIVTTPSRPWAPPPALDSHEPANHSVASPSSAIRARLSTPVGDLLPDSLRLFVDKREVTSAAGFDGAKVTYVPPVPWAPGAHSVGLEISNSMGGLLEARWSFSVAGNSSGLEPVTLGLVVLLVAAAARRR